MSTSVTQTVDTGSSPSIADQIYAGAMTGAEAHGAHRSVVGLGGAIAAMIALSISYQGLDAALSAEGASLAQLAAQLSDQENQALAAQQAYIESLPPADSTNNQTNADRTKAINDATMEYQQIQTTYDNVITIVNALAEQYQSDAANLTQQIAALINNINTVAEINANVARALA